MVPDPARIVRRTIAWFDTAARPLPWREPGTTPWGVLLSEVMLQQTQVSRGIPAWQAWVSRWPTPTALADAPLGEVLVAWDRLGYPRRAKRLHEAAAVIRDEHGGQVPRTLAELRALPGIGDYTAAAVMAFAYGEPAVVLDTNVRRVIERSFGGTAVPPGHITAAERERASSLASIGGARWAAASMELGALVCTARVPRCGECPIAGDCAWLALGQPAAVVRPRRQPAFAGSDRQCRGTVMAAVRTRHVVIGDIAWPDAGQLAQAIDSLAADGLLVVDGDVLRLP